MTVNALVFAPVRDLLYKRCQKAIKRWWWSLTALFFTLTTGSITQPQCSGGTTCTFSYKHKTDASFPPPTICINFFRFLCLMFLHVSSTFLLCLLWMPACRYHNQQSISPFLTMSNLQQCYLVPPGCHLVSSCRLLWRPLFSGFLTWQKKNTEK